MKRLLRALPLLVAVAMLAGCAAIVRAPVVVPPGAIYQHTKAPLDINFNKTAVSTKSGSAAVTFIHLWPIYPGLSFAMMESQTLDQAVKNGGLTTLSYADYELFSVLGVYSRFTVQAYGE